MSEAVFVQKGNVMDYTNGGTEAIAYLEVVPLVTRIGIAQEPIAVGATGSVGLDGVYQLPADSTAAFVAGDALYWDDTANKLTKTATDHTPAGFAFAAKATAGTTAAVRIG